MKKVASKVRITEADTVSDVLVRLYKEAAAKTDGAIAKDSALSAILLFYASIRDKHSYFVHLRFRTLTKRFFCGSYYHSGLSRSFNRLVKYDFP